MPFCVFVHIYVTYGWGVAHAGASKGFCFLGFTALLSLNAW